MLVHTHSAASARRIHVLPAAYAAGHRSTYVWQEAGRVLLPVAKLLMYVTIVEGLTSYVLVLRLVHLWPCISYLHGPAVAQGVPSRVFHATSLSLRCCLLGLHNEHEADVVVPPRKA